jgi:hypothetical protein
MPRHWRSYRRESPSLGLVILVLIVMFLAVTSPIWVPFMLMCLLVALALSLFVKLSLGALIVIILLCCLLL